MWISGFGYADQRIVRGVRIDTFASLLKQDVGFFDAHTSGELASRINADCGAMAGDLVSYHCDERVQAIFQTKNTELTSFFFLVRLGSFVFRLRVW